ncbi:sodium/hydrogen exchanger [Theileria orientalis]|uniref:Sodium/hydrogen exchanger n=1 Tax=Theileria orientalis TaxID=68886 RepID=A0A976QSJ8_THEOR|nr:sodium/hydrogen exchanger [Theileria orientalis]
MSINKIVTHLAYLLGFVVINIRNVCCDSESTDMSGVSVNLASTVSLFIFILVSSCFLQFIASKINDKIPISLILFVYGMIIYGILMSFEEEKLPFKFLKWVASLRRIDNSILYFIALPILLYEATQTIDWYSFCNFLLAGTTLAVVGVVLQVGILGVLFNYTLGLGENWSFRISFLLASILSSTDPVAVLSILGDTNAPNKLITMFNGESLINDGTSVLLFQFFYLLTIGQSSSFLYYLVLFIKLLIVSPLLGVLCGTFVIVWVSFFRKWHVVQSLISVSMGYLLFFCAEYYMNVSGPLSIVCYGLFVKAYGLIAFDREALEKHHVLVEGLSYISNYMVFTISGILTIGMMKSQFLISNIGMKILKLFGVYFFLNVARIIMLLSFRPVLAYTGYKINFKEVVLLLWGGLRGAMVLVLGLRLESDSKIENETSDLISFYISGSSMLILVLQGFTFDWLFKSLNPYPMNPQRREHLTRTMSSIDRKYEAGIEGLKTHWLFRNSDIVMKANLAVPLLEDMKWDKMGRLVYSPNTTKLEDLVVIEEMKEAVEEEEEVEEEENIYLFNHEILTGNKLAMKLRSSLSYLQIKTDSSLQMTPRDSFIVNSIESSEKKEGEPVPEPETEEKELKKEDETYITIFNALSYIYGELYKNDFIDGKSLLTLQTCLNISLDFAINKLNQRSISAWKMLMRTSDVETRLLYDIENWDELAKLEKMDGFEFEWFVLRSTVEEIVKRKLNFVKRANVSFILDLTLAYIEAHEKLFSKTINSPENILANELFKSYFKQINNAKKYVFTIKNKMNTKFYYCLLRKTAITMINLKKEVVDGHYVSGMLLKEDRNQIINVLDQELYKNLNKTNLMKMIKNLFRKFFYLITFNKKMHTTATPL